MDTPLAALILHVVPAEAVENPAFASGHVHGFIAAREHDLGIRDDRNVNPEVRPPIIMDVDVRRGFSFRLQPHEPAPAPNPVQLRHDFLDVFAAAEMLGGPHRAFVGVAWPAADDYEANVDIPGEAGRMRNPGRI